MWRGENWSGLLSRVSLESLSCTYVLLPSSSPRVVTDVVIQGPTPRNDFCRIFAQEGILSPLSFVLLSLCTDKDAEAVDVKRQLLNLLVIFSQSDRKVKEGMTTRSILLRSSLLPPSLPSLTML
jgi:hypothetical protein